MSTTFKSFVYKLSEFNGTLAAYLLINVEGKQTIFWHSPSPNFQRHLDDGRRWIFGGTLSERFAEKISAGLNPIAQFLDLDGAWQFAPYHLGQSAAPLNYEKVAKTSPMISPLANDQDPQSVAYANAALLNHVLPDLDQGDQASILVKEVLRIQSLPLALKILWLKNPTRIWNISDNRLKGDGFVITLDGEFPTLDGTHTLSDKSIHHLLDKFSALKRHHRVVNETKRVYDFRLSARSKAAIDEFLTHIEKDHWHDIRIEVDPSTDGTVIHIRYFVPVEIDVAKEFHNGPGPVLHSVKMRATAIVYKHHARLDDYQVNARIAEIRKYITERTVS